jgi:four helix bundle protein
MKEVRSAKVDFRGWGDETAQLLVLREEVPDERPFELEERSARFGEAIIEFAKRIPETPVNSRLISQLIGAGTSIGANYCEAHDAVSKKEFKQRVGTSRKESKETMFFLRMVAKAEPDLREEARRLWREAKELNLIFGAIWRK